MIPLATFPVFVLTAIPLILSPGPDTIYIIARSVGQGRLAGIVSCLGIFVGLMVQLAAATLGLSALLAASKVLFTVVKWAGAAYLVYLGIRILLSKGETGHLELPNASLPSVFRQGTLTNLLNPKVALFFIAFLPQFVSTKMGRVPLQIFTLGLIFSLAGTMWNMCTATMAGIVGNYLRTKPAIARLQQRFTGLVFIGIGISMVLISRG